MQRKSGFTIVEIIVAMLIGSILIAFVYKTFFGNVRFMESSNDTAQLQHKARQAMQYVAEIFKVAGADPCRTEYWDDSLPAQNNYGYAPLHPYGATPLTVFSGFVATVNPFQVFVAHSDTTTTTGSGLGGPACSSECTLCSNPNTCSNNNCLNVPITTSTPPGLLHNQPSMAKLVFVNGIANATGGILNLEYMCAGFAPGTLLEVPIDYPNPMPGAITLQCGSARVITTNVECFYADYLLPTDSAGLCAPNSNLDGDPSNATCVLNANIASYSQPAQIRQVNSIRLTLILRSNIAEPNSTHAPPVNPCLTDPIFPTGNSTPACPPTGGSATCQNALNGNFRTVTMRQTFDLPMTRYR